MASLLGQLLELLLVQASASGLGQKMVSLWASG
jgi:hypothetical protein